jgi:hypothetical protein
MLISEWQCAFARRFENKGKMPANLIDLDLQGGALSMKLFIRMMFPFLFCAQLSFNCFAQSGIITTYAGSGTSPATTKRFYSPGSVASDGVGGLYVSSGSRIYHVTADGRFHSVAGVGIPGYSGDGGRAISAQLNNPSGLAVDSEGNLYIIDTGNRRIRKVTPDGVISTVAGNGEYGCRGDGGKATSAQLASPSGVAVDSAGNLYIADSNSIRKVTPDGIITTIAGKRKSSLRVLGEAYARTYTGIANLDYGGDGGPAASALLNSPCGVAVDSAGNLFIADSGNHRIRKVTPDGIITTVAGNGNEGYGGDGSPAASAQLSWPRGVAVDSADNLYIADAGNNCIRKVALSSK